MPAPTDSSAPSVRPLGVRAARIAAILAFGPVTGPLGAGVLVNFRHGRPFLGSLYAFLLLSWWTFAPLFAAHDLGIDLSHLL